ncbi:rcc01693 family protein [uncultured Roseobacter sp.]|uniref:rcc01693 family protein n=1 Tax=uncultured Roseobacter sp. TaxID=114847 RepID=UPI002620329D|nr:rcc01693 family protein [uncultured Roseobacter sp.]
MSRLDWPALMRLGLRGLALEPEVFWSLTPAELQVMLADPQAGAPLLSTGLDALMAAYPDQDKKDDSYDR